MPEMCTDSSKSMETPTLARENAVSLVTKKKQLLPDCPALIKFQWVFNEIDWFNCAHSSPYGKHWVHVSIESFDAKIDAIKFTMYGGPQPAEFSCIRTSATEPQIPDYQPQKRVNKIGKCFLLLNLIRFWLRLNALICINCRANESGSQVTLYIRRETSND